MKKYFPLIILLGCSVAFALGVIQLFALRFEAGDVYPPYSSLRADPLGTMAFYESLEKMPGLTVRRDYSTEDRLPEEPGTAYLHLAAEPGEWNWLPVETFHEIKSFLARGGRLVITYLPQTTTPHRYSPEEDETTNSVKSAGSKSKEKKHPTSSPPSKKLKPDSKKYWSDIENEWGFHESFEALEPDGDVYEPVTVNNNTRPNLPVSLDWHSGMIFTNCAAAWQVVYSRDTNAVVIERQFGRGSVIIASDSYFLSNEAMLKDRQAGLLAWVIGPNQHVVFDEAHLGILESPGVAALMRKYRLYGLAAGLLLLAGLFIWKNSTSLVPPHAETPPEEFVTGKDTASGFVNLLRRNIAPGDLLATCFVEWKKSAAPAGQISNHRRQQAETIFQAEADRPVRERNPITTYHQISEILAHRKLKP